MTALLSWATKIAFCAREQSILPLLGFDDDSCSASPRKNNLFWGPNKVVPRS